MTDWIMIVITGVYVIATIFICVFNYRSAKATREQVAETKRQFEEEHRAFVTVSFEIIRSGLVVLHIENHGRQIANQVQITIAPDFIANIPDEADRNRVDELCTASFVLGIEQSWYICLGSHIELEKMSGQAMNISISYEDSYSHYMECTSIDLKQYFWSLIYDSSTEDTYQEMKKVSKSIQGIEKAARKVQQAITASKTEDKPHV